MLYLASPYSHPDPLIQEVRYHKTMKACAWLITERKLAVKGDFLIGAGFSNQFAMHFTTKTLFYDSDLHDLFLTDNLHSTILGLGFTYFTEEEAPANLITGVIGWHTITATFAEKEDPMSCFGVLIGVGREFSKHWLVGIDGFWGKLKSGSDIFGSNNFGFGVHVSHLFY